LERKYQIITFYEFKDLPAIRPLVEIRDALRLMMKTLGVKGTIIIGDEGFNSTVAGEAEAISAFIGRAEELLQTTLRVKSSFGDALPFRRADVKIKPEIVTLKRPVDISLGTGTHVNPTDWNTLISEPGVVVLDTRNDYEFRSGTFRNAVNPETEKFSDLPAFVSKSLDPEVHKKVAMFCTGGIRCEKFAPYLVELGFEEVYQLEGGILRYLEETPTDKSLWEGECFVFDDRVTVDENLKRGTCPDLSQGEKA
jgi:UPF0176 protein